MTAIIKQLNSLEQQLDRYFEQHESASPQLADWLAQQFDPATLVSLLQQLIKSPQQLAAVAQRSYFHGNGFLKVVLLDKDYKLRLHVWHKGEVCEENIHSHRWSFASTVLVGTLRSEIWRNASTNHAQAQQLLEYCYHAATAQQAPVIEPLGNCLLEMESRVAVSAGESYFMPVDQMHCINNPGEQLVATLICTSPTEVSTNRLIKTRHDIEPSTNPPRLQASQLRGALQRFLTLYEEELCVSAAS